MGRLYCSGSHLTLVTTTSDLSSTELICILDPIYVAIKEPSRSYNLNSLLFTDLYREKAFHAHGSSFRLMGGNAVGVDFLIHPFIPS